MGRSGGTCDSKHDLQQIPNEHVKKQHVWHSSRACRVFTLFAVNFFPCHITEVCRICSLSGPFSEKCRFGPPFATHPNPPPRLEIYGERTYSRLLAASLSGFLRSPLSGYQRGWFHEPGHHFFSTKLIEVFREFSNVFLTCGDFCVCAPGGFDPDT